MFVTLFLFSFFQTYFLKINFVAVESTTSSLSAQPPSSGSSRWSCTDTTLSSSLGDGEVVSSRKASGSFKTPRSEPLRIKENELKYFDDHS